MRTATCWLALAVLGVCGSVASAQSPLMYGVPPAPGYGPGYPYGQPTPYYTQPQGYAPQPYYHPAYGQPIYVPPVYQPQPRVLYVPATPAPSEYVPASGPSVPGPSVKQPTTLPVQHALPRTLPAAAPGSEANPVVIYEGGVGASQAQVGVSGVSTAAKPVQAKTTSLFKSMRAGGCGSDCGGASDCPPATCGSDACSACVAPKAPRHPRPCCNDDDTNWLPKCHWNLQILGGAYSDIGGARYNWMQGNVRLGHVCCGECLSCLPGGFEGLIEFTGAATTESDFGSQFYGGGLILRYNLVQPGSRLVPYVQAGVGFQYNDAYRDEVQTFLGSPVQLTAQAQFGMRIFLNKCWSLDMEAGVQRIASMNMHDRDDGITGVGGSVGFTYFFPHGGHR